MKKLNLLLSALAASVFLSGCVGTDFKRPEPDALRVGKSTQADVLRVMGPPRQVGEILKNEKKIKTATYAYAEGAGTGKYPGVTPARAMVFSTFDELLVGQEFISSFPQDATDFDELKVASIVKGKTTRAEVIALLGRPTGDAVYPLVKNQADAGVIYGYTHVKGSAFNMKLYSKLLIVSFGANDIVSDVDYVSSGNK